MNAPGARGDGAGDEAMGQLRSSERAALIGTRTLYIFMLLVFFISPVSVLLDGQYSMVLSDSVLRHGSTHLNAYRFPGPIAENAPCRPPPAALVRSRSVYQLDRIAGNVVYCYPNGSAILSLPFVALMEAVGVRPASPAGVYNLKGEWIIQKILAALLMAGLTCLLFGMAHLVLDESSSLLVALGAGLGSPIWSTASRSVWPQTWLIFLAGWVAYLLLKCARQHAPIPSALLATLLSWMYFVRPTAAIPVICVSLYIFVRYRRKFLPFALVGMVWLAGFVLYSRLTFGTPMPGYYANVGLDWRDLGAAAVGTLISPSRGLFVFMPIVGFVMYLLIRYWHCLPYKTVALVAIAIVACQVVVVTLWPVWWGGWSYGPRLEADSVPWLVLLAILGLAARGSAAAVPHRRLEGVFGAALLALSVAMNGRGALSYATYRWNSVVDVDDHPERVFDWSYPQFLAGLVQAPNFGAKPGSAPATSGAGDKTRP